eukprot:COSAG01_NODE_58905_length_303_cov_0.794118_1_plen_45_part_10
MILVIAVGGEAGRIMHTVKVGWLLGAARAVGPPLQAPPPPPPTPN